MPRPQFPKRKPRPRGRPPIEGLRRVLVTLDDFTHEAARKLGNGNVSAGLRKKFAAS